MMTTDSMIEVLQAAKEGKQIQCHSNESWRDCVGEPSFNFFDFDFRVKPEAKYQYVLQDNETGATYLSAHQTKPITSDVSKGGVYKILCRADWTKKDV